MKKKFIDIGTTTVDVYFYKKDKQLVRKEFTGNYHKDTSIMARILCLSCNELNYSEYIAKRHVFCCDGYIRVGNTYYNDKDVERITFTTIENIKEY